MWRSDEPGYFHICTDGNAVPWIFQDDEDFIAGVNRIGHIQDNLQQSFLHKEVRILAYIQFFFLIL